jgi:hypothetical protein
MIWTIYTIKLSIGYAGVNLATGGVEDINKIVPTDTIEEITEFFYEPMTFMWIICIANTLYFWSRMPVLAPLVYRVGAHAIPLRTREIFTYFLFFIVAPNFARMFTENATVASKIIYFILYWWPTMIYNLCHFGRSFGLPKGCDAPFSPWESMEAFNETFESKILAFLFDMSRLGVRREKGFEGGVISDNKSRETQIALKDE